MNLATKQILTDILYNNCCERASDRVTQNMLKLWGFTANIQKWRRRNTHWCDVKHIQTGQTFRLEV